MRTYDSRLERPSRALLRRSWQMQRLLLLLILCGFSRHILAQTADQGKLAEQIQKLTESMAQAQAQLEQSQHQLDEMRQQLTALQCQMAQNGQIMTTPPP